MNESQRYVLLGEKNERAHVFVWDGVTVYNALGCDGISHLFQSSSLPLSRSISLFFTPAANQHLKGSFDSEKESEGSTGRWG